VMFEQLMAGVDRVSSSTRRFPLSCLSDDGADVSEKNSGERADARRRNSYEHKPACMRVGR